MSSKITVKMLFKHDTLVNNGVYCKFLTRYTVNVSVFAGNMLKPFDWLNLDMFLW